MGLWFKILYFSACVLMRKIRMNPILCFMYIILHIFVLISFIKYSNALYRKRIKKCTVSYAVQIVLVQSLIFYIWQFNYIYIRKQFLVPFCKAWRLSCMQLHALPLPYYHTTITTAQDALSYLYKSRIPCNILADIINFLVTSK